MTGVILASTMHMRLSTLLPALLLVSTARAQQPPCSIHVQLPPSVVRQALLADAARDGDVRYLKCRVVIGATTTVEGSYVVAATTAQVQRQIDYANEVLERCGTGIQLQVCDPFEVNDAPGLYFTGPDQSAFFANRRPGYINIFFVGSFGGVGGGAVMDLVFVAYAGYNSTLIHELGHLLGLGHTFGNVVEELVDGSNCATAGDHICDTPADPGLYLPGMVDVATCTYIGTATDANGDLYQPMLNNVMSYSPCERDSLTPMQGAVMRYVLDSLQVHYLSSTNPVLIDPIPPQLCANAPPYGLSASPGPGTFSGPLVQGDQLINFPNPGGNYSVTYTPDQAPDQDPFELVDAYHVPNLYYEGMQFALVTDSVRQSFRAGYDGEFARIDARVYSAVQQPIRMRLYEGTGTALTLLHDTTMLFANPDTSWMHFRVGPGVPCTANSIYSYVLTADEPFEAIRPSGGYIPWATNSLGNQNLMFRTWVRTALPCQQATRGYSLYEAPARAITNLGDVLCHDDAATFPFAADGSALTASSFVVDGEPATAITPAALAVGPHSAWHIYTINGCTDTTAVDFTVQGPTSFSYDGIPTAVCTTDAPFVPEAAPPLGQFMLDGAPIAVVDPQQLVPGTHTLTHVHTSAQDTVTFADQVCCNTGFALNTFLQDDTLSWQSFVPVHSGELESIRIPLELFNVPRQLVVRLHEGVGVDGPALHTDTITASAHNGVLLTGTGLFLQPSSSYTWSIRKVSDGNNSLPPMIGITWGNHYAAGLGSAPGTPDTTGDLRFQQYITRHTACMDSTTLELMVEVCSGVDEHDMAGVHLYPQPATDRLVLLWPGLPATGARLRLLDAAGRMVRELRITAPRTEFPVGDLPPGSYQALGDGWPQARRVVIMR